MSPTNPNRTPHSSSHEVVRIPAGALLTPPQASVSAGPSFTCPEKRHGGGATGNKNPAAISAPVHSGGKTGSSISDWFKLARGVASERGTDNGWDMGSRARGRDIPSAMLMEERTKALAALNSFPETRGSHLTIIVGMCRLGKADCADNDPHGLNPFCVSAVTNRTSQEGKTRCRQTGTRACHSMTRMPAGKRQ